MDEQKKNRKVVYLAILVVFAVLILIAFLKAKGTF
jgi:hypothetical protein